MSINTDALIKGIVSGKIKPAKVKHKTDKRGQPLTVFDFPQFKCHIHAHFTDNEREAVAPSHIIPYSREKKDTLPIDNYTLAMLRHYAEESGALAAPTNQGASIHKKRRKGLLWWLLLTVVVLVLVFLGALIVLTEGSRFAPYIYTLF